MTFWDALGTAHSVLSGTLNHAVGRQSTLARSFSQRRIPNYCDDCHRNQREFLSASHSEPSFRPPLCPNCAAHNRRMLSPGRLQSGWVSGAELLPLLELGDLVEFKRDSNIPYMHWAVYVGMEDDVKVVCHFSNEGSDLGTDAKFELSKKLTEGSSAHVRVDPFVEVAGNSLVRINNSMDLEFSPFPPAVVKERCFTKLGNRGYNLIFNNCEQFSKWARYGCSESDQSNQALSLAVGGVTFVMGANLGGAVAACTATYAGIRAIRNYFHNSQERNII